MAHAVREQHPEVLGLQEPGVLGLGRGEIDQSQLVQDLLGDRAGERRGAAGPELEIDQRVHLKGPAGGHQGADPAQVPPGRPSPLSVHEQAPLDFRSHQRTQPAQVDLPWPRLRRNRRAPAPELRLVVVLKRDRLPALLIPLPPAPRHGRPAGCAVTAVAAAVPGAQSERRISQARADDHTAGPVAGAGLLLARPEREVRARTLLVPADRPPAQMPLA